MVALFTEDAVIDYGPDVPAMTGKYAIRPMISKGVAELFAATSHHVSNIVIQFDGRPFPRFNRSSVFLTRATLSR